MEQVRAELKDLLEKQATPEPPGGSNDMVPETPEKVNLIAKLQLRSE